MSINEKTCDGTGRFRGAYGYADGKSCRGCDRCRPTPPQADDLPCTCDSVILRASCLACNPQAADLEAVTRETVDSIDNTLGDSFVETHGDMWQAIILAALQRVKHQAVNEALERGQTKALAIQHLCRCGSHWVAPAHSRCESCGETRSQYSQGLQQGQIDAAAAIRALRCDDEGKG